MNFDQYFKTRAELAGRALLDPPADKLLAPDWRFYVAGLLCVAVAVMAVLWASVTQADAGFFARTTSFLGVVLFTGVWLLTMAQVAHVFLARTAVKSRDAVREKTITQLLKIDSAVAHQALRQRP